MKDISGSFARLFQPPSSQDKERMGRPAQTTCEMMARRTSLCVNLYCHTPGFIEGGHWVCAAD